MKDLTVVLVNKPGALADGFRTLGKAGVNVVGTCDFPTASEGILHVLVEDAAGGRERRAGGPC